MMNCSKIPVYKLILGRHKQWEKEGNPKDPELMLIIKKSVRNTRQVATDILLCIMNQKSDAQTMREEFRIVSLTTIRLQNKQSRH